MRDDFQKEPMPPGWWMAKTYAGEMVRKALAWRPTRDWASQAVKSLSYGAMWSALWIALIFLALQLPGQAFSLTSALHGFYKGEVSTMAPSYRSIEVGPESAALWAQAVVAVPRSENRSSYETAWARASAHAKDNHRSSIMIPNDEIEGLAKSTANSGIKRKEAVLSAIVASIEAGDAPDQMVAKAKAAVDAMKSGQGDPNSKLAGMWGPVVGCSGWGLSMAMLPWVPEGSQGCASMSSDEKGSIIAMGLLLCLLYAALAWVAYSVFGGFSNAIHNWKSGQERKLLAHWERAQMAAGSKAAPAPAKARQRL